MTRKDYELIARTFRVFTSYRHESPTGFVVACVADALANQLALANPRFDRAKFLAACNATDWLAPIQQQEVA